MKFRVVACGVFEPYLRQLADQSAHTIDIRCLDAGLHARPNDLRLLLQSEIDSASRADGFDAMLLLYGLCGRGAAGLVARDLPVVIPRVHDCISLFLGSADAYLKQFRQNPGTIYHTLGWVEKQINPRDREAGELYRNFEQIGYDEHPEFAELEKRYGADNARQILAFHDRWKQHYTRAAYIDLGFTGEEQVAEFTQRMADVYGWRFDRLQGDASLIHEVLSGNWESERLFVLPPHSRCVTTGDDRIFAAAAIDSDESETALSRDEVVVEVASGAGISAGIGLGIDAGGTFTDAVIYDLGERTVLAKAKSLTTYHDLVEGICGALDRLPAELLRRVDVTSLSTTLATNSVVEGRGHRVGLIVLSPWVWSSEQISHEPMAHVPGSVNISGDILTPLDEDAALAKARWMIEEHQCSAIVVAGYATVRNPIQANRVREIILEHWDLPVICSHEVSRRLNAIHGAQTAIANARLLPVIHDLIQSVHQALADHEVPGRLMVVKGDGSPVDEQIARARPVETILSGPAASAIGARVLTGLRDALVIDVGGTTTDCALLVDGQVAVRPEGARIGAWVMGVDAVDISTVGLGGDSRFDFTSDRKIQVGPARNIPLCCLAEKSPAVQAFLDGFEPERYARWYDATPLDVLVLSRAPGHALSDREQALLELLKGGPMPALEAAERLGLASTLQLPLKRLEQWGLLKRGGLTPTDLMHIDGRFRKWSVRAAERALEIFAAMLGCKTHIAREQMLNALTRRVFAELIRREVISQRPKLYDLPEDWDMLLGKAFCDDGAGIAVNISLRRPVIAIGAPAESLVTPVTSLLNCTVVTPEHADVANAVGAIASEITVREEVSIRPGDSSSYVLYSTDERIEFDQLERATSVAVEISRSRARQRAIEAGAHAPQVTVTRRDRLGSASHAGVIFLERRITAVASGAAFMPAGAPNA